MTTPPLLDLFAVSSPGLDGIVVEELRSLGIGAEPATGGASWRGGVTDLYRANLHLRTASRVLVRIGTFRARSFIELERHARRIDWSNVVPPGTRVRFRVTSRKSRLYHERAIAERFLRWVEADAGAVPEGVDGTGGEDIDDPGEAQLIVVRMFRDECVVSADASGENLHRRGYRQAVAKAPLRETLAAAMLLATGWEGAIPVIDPLCGSGTIPIEAALLARRIAPGLATAGRAPRSYAFERWRSFAEEQWRRVVGEARDAILPAAGTPIIGTDRDAGAIEAARANAARAGVEADVVLEQRALSAVEAPQSAPPGLLITNPPYGTRVGDKGTLRNLYATLGNLVRTRLPGWRLALLSGDETLERHVGIELREEFRTTNGGIPVRLLSAPPAP